MNRLLSFIFLKLLAISSAIAYYFEGKYCKYHYKCEDDKKKGKQWKVKKAVSTATKKSTKVPSGAMNVTKHGWTV